MKRINLCFIFLLVMTCCEEILHENEYSIAKIEGYNELLSAVSGVYGRLSQIINYGANLKGDDLSTRQIDYSQYYGATCETVYPIEYPGGMVDFTWESLYKVIASANNIIVQYDIESVQNQPTCELLGEIYLIRAFCYFRLTRTYGQVPLVDDIDINFNQPKASFEEIYEFIENDLKIAGQLLPVNNNTARIPFVTPHRGVAKAILAEVYLSWAGYPLNDVSKYAMAAREAGEVIDSSGFFGLGLLDDFSYLWDRDHYYNKESIFSLLYEIPMYDTVYTYQRSSLYESNISHIYQGYSLLQKKYPGGLKTDIESPFFQSYFYPTELHFFNNYPPSYRKDITFYTNIYVPNEFPFYPAIDTGYIHISQINGCSRIGYRKFFYMPYRIVEDITPEGFPFEIFVYRYYGNSRVYLFRYASTLLTYAEASARSGNVNAKAYECINQIRRRANHVNLYSSSVFDLQPGLSQNIFADSVVCERAWELCGEPEGRWFDLIRLEQVENLPNLRVADEFGPPDYPCNKDDYFFPLPDFDKNLNPNLN